jgi:hypothetical protein
MKWVDFLAYAKAKFEVSNDNIFTDKLGNVFGNCIIDFVPDFEPEKNMSRKLFMSNGHKHRYLEMYAEIGQIPENRLHYFLTRITNFPVGGVCIDDSNIYSIRNVIFLTRFSEVEFIESCYNLANYASILEQEFIVKETKNG